MHHAINISGATESVNENITIHNLSIRDIQGNFILAPYTVNFDTYFIIFTPSRSSCLSISFEETCIFFYDIIKRRNKED